MRRKHFYFMSSYTHMTKYINPAIKQIFRLLGLPILLFVSSFQIFAQSIQINNISIQKSFVANTVLITGIGFDATPANLTVWFGASRGDITSSSNSIIEVNVPAGATYDNVVVTNKVSGLSASSNFPFLLSYGGDIFDESKISAITDFPTENGLYDLCLCDFNDDGKTDIVTANDDSNFITVLTNTSTFATTTFDVSSVTVNSKTLNIKCKDLDGDGKPEILLSKTGNTSNIVYYLKNTTSSSTISFASPVPLTINSNTARRIEVEDLDLDGRPEIIATNQSTNSINIFNNNSTLGVINFNASPIVIDIPNLQNSTGLVVKDLNGDALPEISVSPFLSANVYILKNTSSTGNIAFADVQTINVAGGIANIVAGDLNDDGKLDIVATNFTNNQISILQNTSSGDGSNISFNLLAGIGTNATPWGLDLGDLNGDGKLDIAVSSITVAGINTFVNSSTSGISFTQKNLTINENSRNIKIGDINGDGKPDLAFTSIVSDNISTIINQNCITPELRNEANIALCAGATLKLNTVGSLNVNYKWYKNDGTGEVLVKDNNEAFYEEVVAVGNFQFRVAAIGEGGNCIESSQIVNVTVSAGTTPIPPVINDPGKGCEGESITISLNPTGLPSGATFTWTTPSGSTSDTSIPSLTIDNLSSEDAGQYEVEVKNGPCVSESTSIILDIVILSNTAISNTQPLSFCEGLSTELSIANTAGYTYQWIKDGVNIPTATNNSFVVDASGEYAIKVTTPEDCDFTTQAVVVNVFTPPVASFTSVSQSCTNTSIEFTNTSTVDASLDVFYAWDFGDGSTSNEENPVYGFANSNSYIVTLTTSYDASCKDVTTSSVTIIDPPEVIITTDKTSPICEGETITLTASNGFVSYLWNTTADTPEIIVEESGTYSIEAMTIDNCVATAQIDVVISSLPTITITSTQSSNQFQLEATGGIRYEWNVDNTLSALDIANPIATPENSTTYTVTGFDENGCSSTTSITLEITESDPIPAFFTPNGDADNDLWVIRNVQDFEDCTIVVFNRSGQIVFEKKNYSNDWDGTNNGKLLQQGVYYYMINCDNSNSKALTGSVSILR